MSGIIDKISSLNLWFVTITIIAVFAILGVLVGALNGFKTALYFFSWNIAGLVVAVFVVDSIYESTLKSLIPLGSLTNDIGKNAANDSLELLKGVVIMLAIFIGLLVVNFLALIIYFFVRRFLKASIRLNKDESKSNFITRLSGSMVGLVTSIPLFTSLAGLSTIFSRNESVNKLINGLSRVITFSKVDGIYEDSNSMYSLVQVSTIAKELAKFLVSGEADSRAASKIFDKKEAIETFFDSSKTIKIIKSILTDKGGDKPKPAAGTTIYAHIKQQMTKSSIVQGTFSGFSEAAKNNLKTIYEVFGYGTKDSNDLAAIIDFLTIKP